MGYFQLLPPSAIDPRDTSQHGSVRQITDRLGEIQNLADPSAQTRSICAILAKKYRERDKRLSHICSHLIKRQLYREECEQVLKIVKELGIMK